MFIPKLNNFHRAVNALLHGTNKNQYPCLMRPIFGMGIIALHDEQFLL